MFHGAQYYHDGISSPGDQHYNGTGKPWCDDRRATLSSEGADVGPRWRESDAWQRRIERARRDIRRHTEASELRAIEGTGAVFASEDVSGIKTIVGEVFDE